MYHWLFSASLMLIFDVSKNILIKKIDKTIDPLHLALISSLGVSVILFSNCLLLQNFEIKNIFSFIIFTSIVGCLNAIASVLFIKAIQFGEISKILPVINLIPVFAIFSAWLIAKQDPSLNDFVGILLVVIGLFINNTDRDGFSICKGSFFMLCVAIIFSITATLDTLGIKASNSTVWATSSQIGILFFLFIFKFFASIQVISLKEKEANCINIKNLVLPLIFFCIFSAGSVFFQMQALGHTTVVDVISVKRLQVIFTTVIAFVILKEEQNKFKRLFGTILTTVGAVITILG